MVKRSKCDNTWESVWKAMWKIKYPQYHQISFHSVTPISKCSCHSFSHLEKKKKKRPISPYSMCSNYWDIFLLLFNSETSWKSSPSLIPPSESLLSSLQTDFSTQRVPLFRITVPRITKPNGHFSVLAWLHLSGRLSQMTTASSLKNLLHLVPTNICGCTLILVSDK